MSGAVRDDIKAAIRFYERRGKDWLSVVAFLASRAVGTWPCPPPGWVMFRKPQRKRSRLLASAKPKSEA